MTKKRKILIALISILVLIQFIRPEKNLGLADTENDITHAVIVSPEIKNILATSCYDCHSNHTEYPWYSNVQPVASWLAHHVDEGKRELNFSEFNTYKLRRKTHKLKEVIKQIKKDEMPLTSYLIIHKNATLSADQKAKLLKWAEESILALNDTLK
ncbi:MAG: heme-binding domain-containing protein [Bacteroidia bacterium]